MDRSTCSSCGAQIWWVRSAKSGKMMPLNIESEKRVILVTSGGVAGQVVDTYRSHFADCPAADSHRKARPTATDTRTTSAAAAEIAALLPDGPRRPRP